MYSMPAGSVTGRAPARYMVLLILIIYTFCSNYFAAPGLKEKDPRVLIEASGGITLHNIGDYMLPCMCILSLYTFLVLCAQCSTLTSAQPRIISDMMHARRYALASTDHWRAFHTQTWTF